MEGGDKPITADNLKNLIDTGREIEFLFEERKYSITYGVLDGEEVISFCEFYQETTEVKNANELLAVSRNGHTVEEMIAGISDSEIWIF